MHRSTLAKLIANARRGNHDEIIEVVALLHFSVSTNQDRQELMTLA
jgi:hypothetical protein